MDHKVNVGNRSATGRNLGAVQIPTPVGFEPTRAEPTGLAGRRLNLSAKVSIGPGANVIRVFRKKKKKKSMKAEPQSCISRESNPGHSNGNAVFYH